MQLRCRRCSIRPNRYNCLAFLMTIPLLSSVVSTFVAPPPSSSRCHIYGTRISGAKTLQATEQHLVLVGGGHAHVQLIKSLNAAARPPHLRVTLIDAQKSASYSGMVPGCISGLYTSEQTLLHLEPLAKWADIEFVHDRVVDLDLDQNLVYVQGTNTPIHFDVVSLDIGSKSRGLDQCPGAQEFAISTRPIYKLIERLDQQREDLSGGSAELVVVGGGVAGIELAMSVTSRWRKSGIETHCTLLDAGDRLLPAENDATRSSLNAVLRQKGIQVRHGCNVAEITKDAVLLKSGKVIPYTQCIWATGAGSHRLAWHLKTERGLDCDEHGWIQVNQSLQSISHPNCFAAGDCAAIQDLDNGSPPKAGVYAVRAGPVLIENLTRYLESMQEGEQSFVELTKYVPQDDFLKLLVCGDGTALGFRFGLTLQGSWVLQLKDRIDRGFMRLFDVSSFPKPQTSYGKYDTSQYDADAASSSLTPEEGAALLLRSDGEVNIEEARLVLRKMGANASYCAAVSKIMKKGRKDVAMIV